MDEPKNEPSEEIDKTIQWEETQELTPAPPSKPTQQQQTSRPPPPTRPPSSAPTKSADGKSGGSEANLPEEVKQALQIPDSKLNQYVLIRQVGSGGMGAVWKAYDTKLARWVAIKFLSTTSEDTIKRFQREAQVAARLRHPNVVAVYEVNEDRGRHFIVMEFVEGQGIDNSGLDLQQVVSAFLKVCDGIQHAHDVGVIHRDLKPANIMIGKQGIPFVTDFGLAKMMESHSSLSVTGAIMGTPAYMPPEQASGKLEEIDAQSDVYSLGATLYSLLARKSPFEAATATALLMKVCNEDPIPPRKLNPDIPAPLEAIILKAMEKQKKHRYETAKEMGEDLHRFVGDESIIARAPGFGQRFARKVARNPWPFLFTLLFLVGGGVILAFVLNPGKGNGGNTGGGSGGGLTIEQKWTHEWDAIKDKLVLYQFKVENPFLVKDSKDLLSRMPEDLTRSVAGWFFERLSQVPKVPPRTKWTEERSEAKRIIAWCGMMVKVIEDLGEDFQNTRDRLSGVSASYAPVASFRGTVTLRVFIFPHARIKDLSIGKNTLIRNGRPEGEIEIMGGDTHTPVVLRNVEIGDYRITLIDPDGKEHTFPIKSEIMEDGGEYVYSGSIKDATSLRLRSTK